MAQYAPGAGLAGFRSSADSLAYLAELRWGAGFRCPNRRCRGTESGRLETRGLWICRACRGQFSATAGTALHGTHAPLPAVFEVARALLEREGRISGRELQRQLGLSSYKTVFGVLERLRCGMEQHELPLLNAGFHDCIVPCKKLVRGKPLHGYHKSCVILIAQIRRPAVRAWVAFQEDHYTADPGRWMGTGVDPVEGAIPPEPDRPERLAEELIRWVRDDLHGVSHELLQSYLDEFVFRECHRYDADRGFEELMRSLLATSRTKVRRAPFRQVKRDLEKEWRGE